jgi:acrylyl-CoA reductase (NADPH)
MVPTAGRTDRIRALRAEESGRPARLVELDRAEIGVGGEVEIDVEYSSVNYKDGLAVTGRGPIVRRFPLVCGIDLAGRVRSSSDPRFSPGDAVLATGYGLGEDYDGGYASTARVGAHACVVIPAPLDARRAMAIGTAGLAAMLSVLALEVTPDQVELPVVVTGASGGVGSLAVALLAGRGYRVVASTGKLAEEAFLRGLGATEVRDRGELAGPEPPALARPRFCAGVDVVGGRTLANVLSVVAPGGTVAVSGLAGGAALETTMYPFILRGVTLHGVNAVRPERSALERAWSLLAVELAPELLDRLTTVVELDAVPEVAAAILAGAVRGRVVVELARR